MAQVVSNYDPSVFYTPMYTESSQPTKPVRKFPAEPIKLTVTLKDIGLEGLDSPSPDLASKIFQRNLQKKQRKSQRKSKGQQQRSISPAKAQTTPIHPPSTQRRQIAPRTLKIMVFEGDSIKNKKSNTYPKPIGLLSASQKPQPIITKPSSRGSHRLNTSGSVNGSGIFNSVEKNTNDQIESEKLVPKNEEEEKLSLKPLEQLFEKEQKSDENEKLSTKPLDKLFEKEQKSDENGKLSTKPLDNLLGVDQNEQEEAPLEPKYLVEIDENRNQCYDNIWINADRGMPGNPLEKELKEQEEREAAELSEKLSLKPLEQLFDKEQKSDENEKLSTKPLDKLFEQEQKSDEDLKLSTKPLDNLLGVDQNEQEEAPLEPKYLVEIDENRNQCYDNIWINADRGMPGNPLEKELKEQEEREDKELGEDSVYYQSHLE